MKIIALLVTCALLLTSCTFNCDEVRHTYFLGKECNLVITHNESTPRNIDVTGYNPLTKQAGKYKEGGGVYIELINAIALHDTLVKAPESDFFLLKKCGITLKFGLKCTANATFDGISQDTLGKNAPCN